MTFCILRASLDFIGVGGSARASSLGFETPRTGNQAQAHTRRPRQLTRLQPPPSVPHRSCGYTVADRPSHGAASGPTGAGPSADSSKRSRQTLPPSPVALRTAAFCSFSPARSPLPQSLRTSGPPLRNYLCCRLPKASCLSAHDSCEDPLLFHVPEGPCTRVRTLRAEVASSLSLSHTHARCGSHTCSQGGRRRKHPAPQTTPKHPGQPLTRLPWRSRGPGQPGGPVGVRNGLLCPSCFPRHLQGKPGPSVAHWKVSFRSIRAKNPTSVTDR